MKGKQPDLRKLHMTDLKKLVAELGMPRDQIDSTSRWDLVKYIANNSYDRHDEYYRDKKHNQQELNMEFQKQVDMLFREQTLRLQNTSPPSQQPLMMAVNMFAEDTPLLHLLEPLQSPDQLEYFHSMSAPRGGSQLSLPVNFSRNGGAEASDK